MLRPMRGVRRGRIKNSRSLLATAAAGALFASTAAAQTIGELPVRVPGSAAPGLPLDLHGPPAAAPVPSAVTDEGLHNERFYLEADTLVRDDRANRRAAP